MDPVTVLGIVNAAANLGLRCVSIVHALHTAAERYKTVELSIFSLVEECSTIEFAWEQLRLHVQELASAPENEHIVQRIQRSLHAGELVISALQKDLDDALSAPLKSGFLQRSKAVWKEDILKDHESRVRGQVGALTLLLQVIRLPRPTEREHLLTVKARVFDDSDASAYSIVPSMRDAASISSRATGSTAVTDASEDIRYIPFDFEDSLFTSWVYKRNFRPPPAEPSSSTGSSSSPGRRMLRGPHSNAVTRAADHQSIIGSSSGDGGGGALSSTTSTGSSISHGSSVRTSRSLATPITPARSSGRTSFSSTSTSPAPGDSEKLTKLFEVMGLPKDEAARKRRDVMGGT